MDKLKHYKDSFEQTNVNNSNIDYVKCNANTQNIPTINGVTSNGKGECTSSVIESLNL